MSALCVLLSNLEALLVELSDLKIILVSVLHYFRNHNLLVTIAQAERSSFISDVQKCE